MTISVLGLGPMGQALAGALLDAGLPVAVWNRTTAKADGLVSRGAVAAPTPGAAIEAAEVTLVNVLDHQVVDHLLAEAGPAVAGRLIVGLSSDTPQRSLHTAELVAGLGGRYLDGAIMTPTGTIGTSSASILFAGLRAHFDAGAPTFAVLGTATWLGEAYDRAAAYDMALLDVFWTALSGYLHAVEVARRHGIAPTDLVPHAVGIVEILPPIFAELGERIEHARHDDPSATVASLAASLHHLIDTSRAAGVDPGTLGVFQRQVDCAVAAGHGAAEISAVTM